MTFTTSDLTKIEAGAKLGKVLQSEESRRAFVENPTQVLAEVGAKSDVVVLADTIDTVHLVIPAEIDSAKVASGDETYFEELGRLALAACYYEDLPE